MKSSFDKRLVSEALEKSGGDSSWLEADNQQSKPELVDPLMSIPEESESSAVQDSGPLASIAPQIEEPPAPSIPAPVETPSTVPTSSKRPATKQSTQPVTTDEAPASTVVEKPVDVEDRTFNPKASSKTLQTDLQEGQNRQLDLTEATKGGIAAEGSAAQADEFGKLREIQKSRREAVTNRLDLNRNQKEVFEQRMFAKVDEMSNRMRHPPQDTTNIMLSILGSALSSKGGAGAAISKGIGMAMQQKMLDWQAGVAADQAEFAGIKSLFDSQNQDSESELRQEANLSALATSEFDSALKQIAASTQSKEAKAAAEAARLELRQKFVQHQLDIRKRAATTGQQDEIIKFVASQPTPELQAAAAAKLGKRGLQALVEIQKGVKGAADISASALGGAKTAEEIAGVQANTAKTQAEAAKLQQEAGLLGSAQEPLSGYKVDKPQVWNSLEKSVKADFTKGAASIPGLMQQLKDYKSLVAKYGTENLPTEAKAKMQGLHAGILSGIKEAAELGALDNGVIGLVERQIGDPTGWNLGFGNVWEQADTKADTTMQTIRNSAASKARAYGLDIGEGTLGVDVSTTAPLASTSGPVPMVNPQTGQKLDVDPSKIANAERLGFTRAR
jgi:hypothetical protein